MANQADNCTYDENSMLNTQYEWENNEEDILDYDESFLLDTPDLPEPATEAKNKNMRSTDVSSFKDLFLKADIIQSLNSGGYEHPSEIQSECIPQALLGSDILAEAQSGTGKTLTFILSTLHLLEAKKNEVHTLVICPTRELAYQIGKQYECFSKHLSGVKIATFFGGLPIKNDINVLTRNCPHIVVGTVGRILALIKTSALKVQHLKHFVLDECDQMLKLPNTKKHIQEIYSILPRDKQVMMFSATLSNEARTECKKFMKNPIEIYLDSKGGLRTGGLKQYYLCVEECNKFKKLVEVLGSLHITQAVIFVKSVKQCRILENLLIKNNHSATGIHRTMSQKDRLIRYEEIKSGKKKILVATNIFGRGMDVGNINTVINFDMPADPDSYLHSVSRAGRFDTVGTAVTFVANEEQAAMLTSVQTKFQVKIDKLTTHRQI